jgi:hypothetical protein
MSELIINSTTDSQDEVDRAAGLSPAQSAAAKEERDWQATEGSRQDGVAEVSRPRDEQPIPEDGHPAMVAHLERWKDAQQRYPDWEAVVEKSKVSIPRSAMLAIVHSENGPDVTRWLGQHPREAGRLWQMSEAGVQAEIKEIASKFEPRLDRLSYQDYRAARQGLQKSRYR